VQIQMANAVGTMLSSAKMQLFGDPSTVATMSQSFLKSVGWGLAVDGLVTSTPEGVQETARKLLAGTGSIIQQMATRMLKGGEKVDPSAIEQAIAEAIAKARSQDAAAAAAAAPEASEKTPPKKPAQEKPKA